MDFNSRTSSRILIAGAVGMTMGAVCLVILAAPSERPRVSVPNSSAIMERMVVTKDDAWVLNRAMWKHGDHFVELCWMSVDHFNHGTVAIEMIDCEKYRQIQLIEKAQIEQEKKR